MNRKCFLYSALHCLKISRSIIQWHSVFPFSVTLRSDVIKRGRTNINMHCRTFHVCNYLKSEESEKPSAIVTQDFFDKQDDKSKDTFLDMIRIYETNNVQRRGHVEFIYTALKHMEEFGVHRDLEVYKTLIDVLPKGKFIPTNIFQAEFFHYPKQQQCIIDLLEQMEDNGIIPDTETEALLINIFGTRGHPVRKFWRMMYWMPKFKNLSPWPVPNPVPSDSLELAKLAIERMTSVDLQTKIKVYKTSEVAEAIDSDTWIVSGQSPVQKELLDAHPRDISIFVEGAFRVWLRSASVNYFILRADPGPKPAPSTEDPDDVGNLKMPLFEDPAEQTAVVKEPSVHEQDDGTIFAMCATGTSSRDSLLSWIRCLEADGNLALSEIPVLFKSRSPLGEVVPVFEDETDKITGNSELNTKNKNKQ